MDTILTAAVALIGVFLGAFLNWRFSYHTNIAKQNLANQIQVYSRFLVWDRSGLDEKSILEACRARTLMAVYASNRTIKAINTYEELGGVACSSEQREAFVAMFNAFRKDLNLQSARKSDMLTLLYLNEEGSEVST